MKIGFIGLGNMATAMIGGMLQKGIAKPEDIIGSSKTETTAEKVKTKFNINTTTDNTAVAEQADILFLAVKPIFFPEVIAEIKDAVKTDTLIVSIAAGRNLQYLKDAFGRPELKLIRCMPNTPALVLEGCTGVCIGENVTEEETEQVLSLPLGSRSGLLGLSSLSCNQLQQIRGIGEVKAVRICCIFELARRIALGQRKKLPAFPDPATAADYCRPMFEEDGGMLERTILLLLDGKGCLIREKLLSIGTIDAALVSPREIFLQALRVGAVSFLLLHNHPSGDVTPSPEDKELTKRLAMLGGMMQLCLTDHIIVGDSDFFSFRQAGLI